MKKFEISRFWYYLVLVLIIIVSYFNFSALYYPFLDINTAITILMTPGFSIPGDLYLWGQNFFGSLVPFLAQLLALSYRFPPDMAVSVVHYVILIGGFLALSTFFRSRFLKLLMALTWFIPAWHSIGQVTNIFSIQFSLLIIGIYLLNRYKSVVSEKIKAIWMSLACIAFITSVWVSDLSFVSLILLILFLFWEKRSVLSIKDLISKRKEKSSIYFLLTIGFWLLAGFGFLWYAKSHASNTFSLARPLFSSPVELFLSLKIVLLSIFKILIFSSGNIFESVYAWGALLGLLAILKVSWNQNRVRPPLLYNKWALYFMVNGIILFFCIISSHWVFLNGLDRKYFSIVVITLWTALLLFTETSEISHPVIRKYILTFLILLGSFSSLYPLYLPHLPSSNTALSELKTLNTIGLIGASSAAYFSASVDPTHIKATPHEKEYIRNFNLVQDVIKQNRIFLIKNGWLSSFPDTISQFGILLQRTGEPFHKSGYELCRYERIIKRSYFSIGEMKYQGTLQEDTTAYTKQVAMITPGFDRNKHFIYGPFIHLLKGRYTVLFRLKTSRDLSTDNVAVLDISANYGKEIIASKTIRLCDFAKSHHFEEFDISFETAKDYDGVEFRVMFLGGVDLWFERVVLAER
jgi:hypothetical protein